MRKLFVIKKLLILSAAVLFTATLSACGGKNNSGNNDKPIIAVSIAPEATFVQKICGDDMKIITMIPAGASAESYELKSREIRAFSKADIYFAIGVPAEENSILPSVSKNTKVVDLALAAREVHPDLMIGTERDPHIWLSPKRVQVMVSKIADELAAAYPEKAETYRKNAENYILELENLDNEIKNIFKEKNGSFFVFHPAFGYFADDYSLKMYALEEEGRESTPKQLAALADIAKKENIKVIFCQAEASDRQAKAFADEIGGRVEILEPLSADYANNLKKMATLISEAMN